MSVQAAPNRDPWVIRTEAIADPGDLIAALPVPGISWVRRGEGMVAWGEVARFEVRGASRFAEARAWWADACSHAIVRDDVGVRGSGLVAFGSFSFADASPAGGVLIVPRYVLGRRNGLSWLTVISDSATISPPGLDEACAEATPPRPLGRVDVDAGDQATWAAAVGAAIARINAGAVDKVVLARAVDARADGPVDVRSLLAPLARDYPTCWTFHVDGMFGATPELLARVDRGLVTSRVLAGTIRPTGDETADLAHAAALARSSKDREEHEYAVRSVADVLERHCSSINVPEAPSVIHLPNVMHLSTDVTGVLSDHTTSLELV
ncbi:MAG TPA: chorismate-binding protein, partial [Demequinaceae bacterium]